MKHIMKVFAFRNVLHTKNIQKYILQHFHHTSAVQSSCLKFFDRGESLERTCSGSNGRKRPPAMARRSLGRLKLPGFASVSLGFFDAHCNILTLIRK